MSAADKLSSSLAALPMVCRSRTFSGRSTMVPVEGARPLVASKSAGISTSWFRDPPASSSSVVRVTTLQPRASLCELREFDRFDAPGSAGRGSLLVLHADSQGFEGDVFHHEVVLRHGECPVLELDPLQVKNGTGARECRVLQD